MFIYMAVGSVCAFHMQIYPSTILDETGLLQEKVLSFFYLCKLCCKERGGGGGGGVGHKKKVGVKVSNQFGHTKFK